ncbi:hypothetical protein ACE38W_02915 [Chitinophaga sp. Hz27]|uniref:hypothetical protein n=1 Tax=Chitinophaga sp. Hz27 TaxID=3347169 RepID=UPI0035E10927
MYNVYHRSITDKEAEKLARMKPVAKNVVMHALTTFLVIISGLFMASVTMKRVSDPDQHWPLPVWTIILVACIGIGAIVWLKRIIRRNQQMHDISIALMQVEVLHIKTNHAIVREADESLGEGYYLDVYVNGQQRTLYLQNPKYDYWAVDTDFPNTEFEIVRTHEKEIIGAQFLGQYLMPERELPAFDDATLATGNYPKDGDLLDISIFEVTA